MNETFFSTVHEWFVSIADQFPGKVAVSDRGADLHHFYNGDRDEYTVTYEDLNRYSEELKSQFESLFENSSSVIGVFLPSSIHLVISILGIFKSGGTYLQLGGFYRDKLDEVLKENIPSIFITNELYFEKTVKQMIDDGVLKSGHLIVLKDDYSTRLLVIRRNNGETIKRAYKNKGNKNSSDPYSPSHIFYTSGSVGGGKGVVGNQMCLAHFIRWEIKEFGITKSMGISQLMQPSFDASLRDIFLALCTGATLYIPSNPERYNILKLVSWIDKNNITILHCGPSIFRVLTKELKNITDAESKLRSVNTILLSGEMLYVTDVTKWRSIFGGRIEIVNLYGATEATLIQSFYRIGELSGNNSDPLPIGSAIDGVTLLVLNGSEKCNTHQVGEIFIKSDYLSQGYINQSLNKYVFVPNPVSNDQSDVVYRTGDLAKVNGDNTIVVIGRIDDQVKINGLRVNLRDIESIILQISGVENVLVKPISNRDNNSELICYYTGTEILIDVVREELRSLLEPSLIPSYVIHLTSFPLNRNGKVDKYLLPNPLKFSINENDLPITNTEKLLSKIWKEVLGYDHVGRKSAFFDLGGSSLKVIEIYSKVLKEFNVELASNLIDPNPTLEHLAQVIDNSRS